MLTCVRHTDGGAVCGQPAELKWGVALCDACSFTVWMSGQSGMLAKVKDLVDRAGGDIYWDFGITYYLLLPNGNVKIGHVRNPEGLADRWRKISYRVGGRVVPLATEYGGSLKEAYRHAQLHQHRIWVPGEEFRPAAEVMQAAAVGHVPMGLVGMKDYARWTPRPETFKAA